MMAGLAPKNTTAVSTDTRNVSTDARTECGAMEAAVNLTQDQYTQAKQVRIVHVYIHLRLCICLCAFM
jgi:hypothetical protein